MRMYNYMRIVFLAGSLILSSCTAQSIKNNHSVTAKKSINTSADVAALVDKISTRVDSSYIYEYENTKFVPQEGKVLYIMGQDTAVISEFSNDVDTTLVPGGWATYWGVPEIGGVTKINSPQNGSAYGYQNHQWLADRFENSVIQSALWIVGKWDVADNTQKGLYDHVIKEFCVWAKSVNRPIYLRIGYEFDGTHTMLEPEVYVKIYKRIVDMIRSENVDNVAFVWHSVVAPTYKGYPVAEWYPGDTYVDWFAVSLFGHMYSTVLNSELDAFLKMAKEHKKPVMIAESAPINGILPNDIEVWNTWFVNYFSFIHNKNIKAFSYINCDWSQYSGFTELNWGNSKLQKNDLIYSAWMKEVAKSMYLKQSPALYNEIGFYKSK